MCKCERKLSVGNIERSERVFARWRHSGAGVPVVNVRCVWIGLFPQIVDLI